MKPYEIEIFDRNFNFRANALVNSEAVKYQRDILTTVSNTITLEHTDITIRTNATDGSAGDQTVGLSDYIRIKVDGDTYSGVIKKLDKEDDNIVITYMHLITLFNHDVYINSIETTRISIERYLKDRLLEEFKNSADSSQNIPGFEVNIHTVTMGVFDFVDATNPNVTINLLNDYIYPAFQRFLVVVYVSFDVSAKKVTVDIGRRSTASRRTIETSLPDIIEKNVVIRSTSNELNKLIIIDNSTTPYNSYTYYLHTDYTVDTDKTTNRMLPVVNTIKAVDMDSLAEHAYWTYEKQYVLTAADLIELDETLTPAQQSQLAASVSFLIDNIFGNRVNSSYNFYHDYPENYIYWILNTCPESPFINSHYHYWDGSESVNVYDDIMEQGEGYFYSRARLLTSGTNRGYMATTEKGPDWRKCYLTSTIPTTTGVISTPLYGKMEWDCNYHSAIKQIIEIELWITIRGNDSIPTKYTFLVTTWSGLPRDEYENAISAYKQTAQYHTDIVNYKNSNLQQILTEYASSVFGTSKYKNLIEIVVMLSEAQEWALSYGDAVDIIHKGTTYKSIFTGFTDMGNGLCKLTFGMIRLELTKILKMERQG